MPHFVGKFLSERMYNNALGTIHASGSNVCCRFVDVTPSHQRRGEDGKSWIVSNILFPYLRLSLTLIFLRMCRKQRQSLKFVRNTKQKEGSIEVMYQFFYL